jgi:hypothetical protein
MAPDIQQGPVTCILKTNRLSLTIQGQNISSIRHVGGVDDA